MIDYVTDQYKYLLPGSLRIRKSDVRRIRLIDLFQKLDNLNECMSVHVGLTVQEFIIQLKEVFFCNTCAFQRMLVTLIRGTFYEIYYEGYYGLSTI